MMRHFDHERGVGHGPGSRYRGPSVRTVVVMTVMVVMALAPGLWAQTTATLQGTVTGPTNQPLQGVQVTVTGGESPKSTVTDDKGFFEIPGLAPGTYRLTASLAPFAPGVVETIVLQGGQTRTQDLVLQSLTFSGEVSVTVQKRTESLLEVPASVTVLTSDTLEEQRVQDLVDLVPLVPGLVVTRDTPGQSRVTLRGINTGGVASTVGVYIGDVPFGSSTGLANGAILAGDFDTFDIAQVEVLRGPQGTLYGASSMGGVLKYVPNLPTTEGLDVRVLGSLEGYEDGGQGYSLKGMINLPLGDHWAVRASGFFRSDDGFIDSIGNNPVPSLTAPGVNIIAGTILEDDINSYDTSGGRFALMFEPSDTFSLLLVAQTQEINSNATNQIDADPTTLEPLYGLVQSRYYPQPVDTTYDVFSATLDWDLGFANLVSVTGYSTFEQNLDLDLTIATALTGGPDLASLVTALFGNDVTDPLSVEQLQTTSTDKFNQEFRLVSPDDQTFEWLVGAFYTDEDSQILQDILAIEADTGADAASVPPLAVAAIDSTYEEYALFGNATWHVTDRFNLSFGARQSWNDQKASQVLDGILVGGLTAYDDVTSSESPFTWSVSPLYNLNKNSSIYARIATGFRPGGPNVLPPGVPEDTPKTFASDTLTSYEAGWKTGSSDGTFALDLSVFYLDWQDIQLYVNVEGVGFNGNGGTAVSKGAELTASVIPTDGLMFSLNGAYTDAYLTVDTDPVVGGLDGDPLPYIPDWTFGVLADYQWTVKGNSTLYVGGGVFYTGDRTYGFEDRTADGSLVKLDSYVTADLRAGAYLGRWSFELYGKNLTNEMGIITVGTAGALPDGAYGISIIRPRTIGATVGVRFWGS
jgi:iron complex outermembrane receptor protein